MSIIGRFDGKAILVTGADRFIGPASVEMFEAEGGNVIADSTDYTKPGAVDQVVANAGQIDILIANLAGPLRLTPFTKMLTPPTEIKDEDFQAYLDELVWPLIRLVRGVLPQMIARKRGKIVAVTSGAPFRPIEGFSIYTAARGAQNAFIRVVGAEVAKHNVQVNAVGPAFVENNIYFTPEMLSDSTIYSQLVADIPAGRIPPDKQAAALVLCMASEASDFMAGQVIPVSGGWAQ